MRVADAEVIGASESDEDVGSFDCGALRGFDVDWEDKPLTQSRV